jgi:hypothetical protein
MKQRWLAPVALLGITGLFWLLLDAADVRTAVLEGLRLCGTSVIPALFPFLAMSSLLIFLGLGEWLARPLGPLMALWNIDGAGASALILGLVGGYPVGARTAAELCREQLLSRDEAERLLTFCNNSNPAFLISLLGLGVFHSLRVGVWLWLIHIASALTAGLLLGRRPGAKHTRPVPRRQVSRAIRFPDALVGAVHSALSGMLGVCAFVVFFYVLALPLRRIGGAAGTALVGILELFSAVPRLTPDAPGLILASGLAGFGGISVLCQTLSVLSGSGLSAGGCVRGKALQGLLAAALTAALAGYILA